MASKPEGQQPAIQVIERIFALLDALAAHQDPVSLKELSETTQLHPSTTHRILNDLALGRFVDRPEAGSYRLGMRLLELGNLVKARLDVRDAALGPMRELHKLTHQPVNLSVRQGDEIVYIERTYSERSGMQVVRAVGGRAPLHLTSVGKLFLAHDEPQRVRAYATRTGLSGHTRNSITDLPRLEQERDLPTALPRLDDRRALEDAGAAQVPREGERVPRPHGGTDFDRLEEVLGHLNGFLLCVPWVHCAHSSRRARSGHAIAAQATFTFGQQMIDRSWRTPTSTRRRSFW